MIEQAMIFALGFLIASVLALAAAPALWRRAMRLSGRRLEMQLPLSAGEIRAERDQVRAEAAVAQRRIEQKLSALNVAHAADMEELGRRATALAKLEEARAALAADLATTETALNAATATAFVTDKTLHDTLELHAGTQAALADLTEAHAELQRVADGRQASLAALEARSAGLQLRLDDLHESLTKVEMRLAAKSHEAAKQAQDLAAARSELVRMTAAHEMVERRLAEETARRAALQGTLDAARRELAQLHEATASAPGGDDALLRRSIHEIGTAVVGLVNNAVQTPKLATDAPRALVGLRISDLRPLPESAAVASAEREST